MRKKLVTLGLSLAAFCIPLGVRPALANPDLYDYDVLASVMDTLSVPEDASRSFDINGDGEPDNNFGAILGAMAALLGGDPSAVLQASIDEGTLNLGATWPGLTGDLADASDVTTHFFNLVDPDENPATRLEYLADRDSFDDVTGQPRYVSEGGVIAGTTWTSHNAQFPLRLPFVDTLLDLVIDVAHLEGTISTDATGVRIVDGRLVGTISLQTLFAAYNNYVAEHCPCLGLESPLVVLDETTQAVSCNKQEHVATPENCSGDDEVCKQYYDFCALLPVAFQPDVDTDGDTVADAISIYVDFTMAGTRVTGPAGPADCNHNGVPDDEEIASGTVDDVNENGVPDSCEPTGVLFHRGDTNADGGLDLSDGVGIFSFLFLGGAAPSCLEAADVNNSGEIDISDGISVLNFLFLGGVPPAAPGPPGSPCGTDPDAPGSPGDLGCAAYDEC